MCNQNTLLSISIVAYHNYSDIAEAIDSLEKFTPSEIKKVIYIIDNGNTPEKYDNILKKYEDVEYINLKDNLGFGKGHNTLLDIIKSDYHVILNPDVYISSDVFSALIDFLSNSSATSIVVPKIIDEQGHRQEVYRRHITLYDILVRTIFSKFGMFKKRYNYHIMKDFDFNQKLEVEFVQGSFLLMRTDTFKKLKGFDDRFFMYLEDADLCKRANRIGNITYLPDVEVVHKWEKGSHKNLKLAKYHIASMYKYFVKWGIS